MVSTDNVPFFLGGALLYVAPCPGLKWHTMFLVICICIKWANQHSLIEQHSLGASNIGQLQEESGDMEETKGETEK